MIRDNDVPILEFDTNRDAKITAASFLNKILPEYYVISFFKEAVNMKKWQDYRLSTFRDS